jgi:tripartite-type tricarboxylate transporter receptor subunit TctC
MRLARRQLLGLAVATTALLAISHIAMAQTYPSRPVTMLVPYGAGGATDTTGRIVAEGMRGPLGQPVILMRSYWRANIGPFRTCVANPPSTNV